MRGAIEVMLLGLLAGAFVIGSAAIGATNGWAKDRGHQAPRAAYHHTGPLGAGH